MDSSVARSVDEKAGTVLKQLQPRMAPRSGRNASAAENRNTPGRALLGSTRAAHGFVDDEGRGFSRVLVLQLQESRSRGSLSKQPYMGRHDDMHCARHARFSAHPIDLKQPAVERTRVLDTTVSSISHSAKGLGHTWAGPLQDAACSFVRKRQLPLGSSRTVMMAYRLCAGSASQE